MQTYTLRSGVWLHRLLARNPLVRASDRVEAVAVVLTFLIAMLAVPVAGAVGTAVHADLAAAFAVQRSERTELQARAVADSAVVARSSGNSFRTPIEWQFAGRAHTAEVPTTDVQAGDPVTIWVDRSGDRMGEPLTDEEAVVRAVIAGIAVWAVTVGLATTGWAVLRRRLDRARYADWDRELDDIAGNDGRTNRNS